MIDKQIEQLVMLGIPEVDRELTLHYLSGKDYNAVQRIIDKNLRTTTYTDNISMQAVQALKTFVDSKVELYNHMFEEIPFDVISDHKPDYEGEEFG